MKVSIVLRITFKDGDEYKYREFIETIVRSLEPDNLQAPKTIHISMQHSNDELVTTIECENLGEAFYSIDDILMMLQMLFSTKDMLVTMDVKNGDNEKNIYEQVQEC
ncbi:MAG: KEOPS complex subunit Pcc1 [Candidatus Geothermarchaeota archaeon]